MKLFSVAKVPMYCEGISHRIERRKAGDAKVVDLALKVQPFTAQLAAALDSAEYGFVKRLLFKQSDATPVRDFKDVGFKLPVGRQKLICFASPDTTKASIALDQVKVTKLRVRGQKDGDSWVLYVHASFGPLGKAELEYVNAFYAEQRFVTFEEAEPSLEFDEQDDEADEVAEPSRPAPMFDTDQSGAPVETAAGEPESARQTPRRHPAHKAH